MTTDIAGVEETVSLEMWDSKLLNGLVCRQRLRYGINSKLINNSKVACQETFIQSYNLTLILIKLQFLMFFYVMLPLE